MRPPEMPRRQLINDYYVVDQVMRKMPSTIDGLQSGDSPSTQPGDDKDQLMITILDDDGRLVNLPKY